MPRRRYDDFSRWGRFPRYVPVAERRVRAARAVKDLVRKGTAVSPVTVEGKAIARTFWGKAWCENLERYSDYANRLPRGRTYVRNGSVVHLSIAAGVVEALVSGSRMYKVEIGVTKTTKKDWAALRQDCTGRVASLVDLLRGHLDAGVMERICRPETGLFPTPRQIHLSCSCPDWASMCKHVAAVLYGVGCRLDADPALLFLLRGVDPGDLIADAAGRVAQAGETAAPANVLEEAEGLDALFGIDLGAGTDALAPQPETAAEPARARRCAERRTTGETSPKKKRTAKRSTRKKAATKKAATRKTATKTAQESATKSAKKSVKKKGTARKTGDGKRAVRKTATRKTATRKTATPKPATRKVSTRKPATRKPAAQKTTGGTAAAKAVKKKAARKKK